MPDPAKEDLNKDGLLAVTPRDDKGRPTLGGISLTRKLGQGGMGAVYQGAHPRLGVEVAVKVLPFHLVSGNPSAIDYFMREAKVAAKLNHPNLVRIFDVNSDKDPRTGTDVYYLIMEFVPGATAGGLMRDNVRAGKGPLPETDALDITIAATSGLVAAHDENIVHRDIKPDNIIVPINDKGVPQLKKSKLMDLGLAKNTDDSQSIGLTAANVAMGTPGYMSPEQAENAKTAGAPADVFSMGATLYALLTGAAPFSGTTVLGVLRKTAEEPHPPIRTVNPNVTPGTALVIDRCLEKNVANRIQTAQNLHDALVAARNGLRGDMPTEKTMVAIQTFAPMEILAEKTVMRTPPPGPVTSATVPVPPPAAATAATPSAKKSPVAIIAVAAVLAIAAIVGVVVATRPSSASTGKSLLAQAEEAETKGDLKGALGFYERALVAEPSNLLQQKVEMLKDRVAKREQYDALVKQGQAAVDKKDWMAAEKHFTEAQKLFDGPEAKAGLDTVRKNVNSAYGDWIEKAKTAVAKRDWPGAESAYAEALKAQSDSPVAKQGLADVSKLRDNERKAMAKAEAARSEKDADRAWSLAHEAIELDPGIYAVHMAAVEAAIESKRPEWIEEAMSHADKAEALAASDAEKKAAADAKAELAGEKVKSGHFLEVIRQLNDAINDDDFERAERILADAKKAHPNRAGLAERERKIATGLMWFKEWKAGDEAEKKGDYATAQAAYEKAEGITSRPKSKVGIERVREARDKAFKEALERAKDCAARRDVGGFAKAVEEAKKLRPGSKEIADLEAKFSAGPLAETHKSGDSPVDELFFSRDGARIIAAGAGYTAITAWDAATLAGAARGNREKSGDRRTIYPVPLAGTQVAFLLGRVGPLQDRYELGILDTAKNSVRMIESDIAGTKYPFTATAIGPTPDGQSLIRVTRDSHKDNGVDVVTIDVINTEDGGQIHSLNTFRGQAHSIIRASAAAGQVVTGGGVTRRWKSSGRDSWTPEEVLACTTLFFWNSDWGQAPVELGIEGGAITAFEFSPDGRRLVAGSERGQVTIVDPAKHEIVGGRIQLPAGPVTGIAVSDTGIAAVTAGGKLAFIDLDTGRKLEGIEVAANARNVLITPDASTLFLADGTRLKRFAVGKLR